MTVTHIVLLKKKPTATSESIDAFVKGITALHGVVPGVIRATAGETFTTERAQGFTHLLVVELVDRAALQMYQTHPDHVAVRDKVIVPNFEGMLAVDLDVGAPAIATGNLLDM
ncbi:dabb-domain-containing protein [Gonapodya prolifera JEL478]|uniref:Dabb-domain-containing protein n=1 Tax=Gonapodya prolifera (strain JEL478) TaxID=1344416 RepID=A0A139ACY6_GONPJ|nr:dabb-domain-containing protein [Gonapodya prolifera JEL478]|eukprot:KXS14686.1 dabb-domain-containing protein [Gonapodya prolifera JEL478]